MFLVDEATDLAGTLRRKGLEYRVEIRGYKSQAERVFREVQRTSSFSNCFSNSGPLTAETWLQAHAVWWDHA